MPIVAAMDLGYSNAKLAWLHSSGAPLEDLYLGIRHSRSDDPDKRAASALKTRLFPAGAAPIDALADSRSEEMPGHIVKVNGEDWRAPVDFKDIQGNYRDFSSEYVKRDVWLALLKGCLAEIGEPEIETLVLGLPSNEYYNSPDLEKTIIGRAKGKHELDGLTVNVKEVLVVPQPLGTFYGQLLSSDKERAEFLLESLVLVIDPGFYSCDVVLINEGKRIYQDSSVSTPNSVKAICDQLRAHLKETHQIPIPEGRLESQLRQGKYTVAGAKGLHNFKDDLKVIAKDVATSALDGIRSQLHSSGHEPNIAILTGGGADLFEPHVKEGTKVAAVYKTDDPVMMNVIGFLRAAC
ncbi:ParM/StbA family protein [Vreelandella rituensis]|uniref:Uncharacterized protein n=1 Tax=Vreelandella rituensis TaxID=2282306 RepID=A0A368UA74_9GAMM|nr:ParM/StbA family protein [Halomonas rituensis]RCV93894.1 hypothetical protein DU506_01675 [Halomonas rituensis]